LPASGFAPIIGRKMKYFWILSLSVLVHMGLFYSAKHIPVPERDLLSRPTVVEIIKRPSNRNLLSPVLDSTVPEELLTDNGKARFLSGSKKRVKKETRAAKSGITKNAFARKSPKKRRKRKVKPSQSSGSGISMRAPLMTESTRVTPLSFSQTNEYIRDVPVGAITALNTDQHIYYSFYSRFMKKLRYSWEKNLAQSLQQVKKRRALPKKRVEWHTRVALRLDPKGYLKDIWLTHKSGKDEFDWAAINAFRHSAPYINPPKGMIQDDGMIHLEQQFVLITPPIN
jgi:hypothetical protein